MVTPSALHCQRGARALATGSRSAGDLTPRHLPMRHPSDCSMIVFLYRAGAAGPHRRLRPSPFSRVVPAR
ncbi:hypothetical protein G6F68_017100 [Rhizopus microsporus]|nr:hypothetical protein G6F68_017100 [Rhizopus microsporus]